VIPDRYSLFDGGIAKPSPRMNRTVSGNPCRSLDNYLWMNDRIGPYFDVLMNVGGLRVDYGDSAEHKFTVLGAAQFSIDLREFNRVVYAGHFCRVGVTIDAHGAAELAQDTRNIRQIILPLDVVGAEMFERQQEVRYIETINADTNFSNAKLDRRRIALLDDAAEL